MRPPLLVAVVVVALLAGCGGEAGEPAPPVVSTIAGWMGEDGPFREVAPGVWANPRGVLFGACADVDRAVLDPAWRPPPVAPGVEQSVRCH